MVYTPLATSILLAPQGRKIMQPDSSYGPADDPLGTSWLNALMCVMAALMVVPICLAAAWLLVPAGAMQSMAFALRPAEFPNSEVTSTHNSGGPTTLWQRTTFKTQAPLVLVLEHFEAQMPGFDQVDGPGEWAVYYVNGRCNESGLSWFFARMINEGHYAYYTADNVPLPCASVGIYQLEPNADTTYYHIWVDWPAP